MRKGDRTGVAGRAAKLEQLREAVRIAGKNYSGEVVLVPGPGELVKSIGRTTGYLMSDYGRGGPSWEETIEEATGLTVVHKGGLVLGGEVGEEFNGLNLRNIKELAVQLPEEQIAQLIGCLGLTLAKR